MRSLSAYVATALLSVSLAAPVTALAQNRIAVATLDGNTIWLDEIMAVAETLPPEYQQQGIAGIYDQLIDEVANSRLAAVAAREGGLEIRRRGNCWEPRPGGLRYTLARGGRAIQGDSGGVAHLG